LSPLTQDRQKQGQFSVYQDPSISIETN